MSYVCVLCCAGLELRSIDIFPFSATRTRARTIAPSARLPISGTTSSVATTVAATGTGALVTPRPRSHIHGSSSHVTSMQSPSPPPPLLSLSSLGSSTMVRLQSIGDSTSSLSESRGGDVLLQREVSSVGGVSSIDEVSHSMGFDNFSGDANGNGDTTPRHDTATSRSSPSLSSSTSMGAIPMTRMASLSSSKSTSASTTLSTTRSKSSDAECMLILELVNTADTTFRVSCTVDGCKFITILRPYPRKNSHVVCAYVAQKRSAGVFIEKLCSKRVPYVCLRSSPNLFLHIAAVW
jgi:hypothetical protein